MSTARQTALPGPAGPNGTNAASAFISYARSDQAFVRSLHGALEAVGREAWVDWEDIPPSADWWDEVAAAIRRADAMVFVLSPASLGSRICMRELGEAVSAGKRLIPVVLSRDRGQEIPEPLRRHNWITFESGSEFDTSVARLLDALDADFDWMRAHTTLLGRAVAWDHSGRDGSRLVRGRELEAFEHWIARAGQHREPTPTALQADFIIASRRAATRGQRRMLSVLAGALVLFVGLTAFALLQRAEAEAGRLEAERQSRFSQSRELAVAASQQISVDPELSILLATEAVQLEPTSEAISALRDAIENSRVRGVLANNEVSPVEEIYYSPDGDWLIGRSDDASISAWQRPSGAARSIAPPGTVARLLIVAAGNIVLAQDWDLNLFAWSIPDGATIDLAGNALPDGGSWSDVYDVVAWNPTRTKALGSVDGGVVVLSFPSLEASATIPIDHEDETCCGIAVSAEGDLVAISTGASITVWEAATGQQVSTMAAEVSVRDVEFTPDGRFLLTTSADGNAFFWDVQTGERGGILDGAFSEQSFETTIDPTGRYVGAGSSTILRGGSLGFDFGGRVRVWDLETGSLVSVLGSVSRPVNFLTFMPEGDRIVTNGGGGLQVWDAQNATLLAEMLGGTGGVFAAAVSPSGHEVATVDAVGVLRYWDSTTSDATETFGRFEVLEGDPRTSWPINWLASTPNGDRLAFDVAGNHMELWDWQSVESFSRFAERGFAYEFALDQDGSHIVTAQSLDDETDGLTGSILRVWETAGPSLPSVCRLSQTDHRVSDVAFAPDGERVVVASGPDVLVMNLRQPCTEEMRVAIGDENAIALAVEFDPSGESIYTTGRPGQLARWDARTGALMWSTEAHRPGAADLDVSVSGDRVATAGLDDVVRVWDTTNGLLQYSLRGHEDVVLALSFSPDGSRLVSGSDDRTAIVWDMTNGSLLEHLAGSRDHVRAVAIGPDNRVATGSGDGYLRIFDCRLCLDNDALIALARSRVTRNLTVEERIVFLHEQPLQ